MKRKTDDDFDYTNLLILSQIKDNNLYHKYYYMIKTGKCRKIKTPMGIAVDVSECVNALNRNQLEIDRATIDLTEHNRFNALYIRINDMTEHNKVAVCAKSTKKIPRFKDQDGYTIINIMDYIEPQINILSKKLDIKRVILKKGIQDLIYELYKERNRRK